LRVKERQQRIGIGAVVELELQIPLFRVEVDALRRVLLVAVAELGCVERRLH
jgi:hypothetical protein